MMKKLLALAPAIFIMSCFWTCQSQKAEWGGSIETVDGVKVIHNPKEPLYREQILSLEEELVIRDSEGPEGFLFSMLACLDADEEGRVYAADQQGSQIHVFDSRGIHLRSFGKRGQGGF